MRPCVIHMDKHHRGKKEKILGHKFGVAKFVFCNMLQDCVFNMKEKNFWGLLFEFLRYMY